MVTDLVAKIYFTPRPDIARVGALFGVSLARAWGSSARSARRRSAGWERGYLGRRIGFEPCACSPQGRRRVELPRRQDPKLTGDPCRFAFPVDKSRVVHLWTAASFGICRSSARGRWLLSVRSSWGVRSTRPLGLSRSFFSRKELLGPEPKLCWLKASPTRSTLKYFDIVFDGNSDRLSARNASS